MSRTWYLLGCAGVLALMALPTAAETSRTLGMGGTAIGVDTTASAWSSNPALLPATDGFPSTSSPWPCTAEFTAALGDDVANIQFINLSLRDAAGTRGFGAGYANLSGTVDLFGAGYGQNVSFVPGLSVGANLANISGGGVDETVFNIGLAYQPDMPGGKLVVGLVVGDVTERFDTDVNLGASFAMPAGVTIAADWVDIGDGDLFNVGAEWQHGPLAVRVGAVDGDLTAGAGYRWRNFDVGFAWQDWGSADAYFGSASVHF